MILAARLAQFVRCGKDRYYDAMFELDRDGLMLRKRACSEAELQQIEAALSQVAPDRAGIRLSGIIGLTQPLSINGCIGRLVEATLGSQAQAVRAILFDKSATTNWALGWHQDRTIVVKKRIDCNGFGPWSIKTGLQHVAPPFALLSRMLTLRVHLDAVGQDNGPLQVVLGSHRHGRIAENEVEAIVKTSDLFMCEAQRGDIWCYATPILHASAAAINPTRRRVLQIDYSADQLPGELEWLGV